MNLEELIKAAEAQERNGNAKWNFNIGTVNAWFPVYVNLKILRDAKRRNRQRRLAKVKSTWAVDRKVYKELGAGHAKRIKQKARKFGVDYKEHFGDRAAYSYRQILYSGLNDHDCVGLIRGLSWGTLRR